MHRLRCAIEGLTGISSGLVLMPASGQSGMQTLQTYLNQNNPLGQLDPADLPVKLVAFIVHYRLALLLVVSVGLLLLLVRALTPVLVSKLLAWSNSKATDKELAFLELTFPADTSKSVFATQQLYALLHSPPTRLTVLQRITGHQKRYSLELVATKDEGIRYILAVPEDEALAFHYNLLSYLPGLKINQTRDHLSLSPGKVARVTDMQLSADFAFPLKGQGEIAQHDPIAYIAGQMTQLSPDETVVYQVALTPISPYTHPKVALKVEQLRDRMARGQALSPILDRPAYLNGPLRPLLLTTLGLLERSLRLLLMLGLGAPASADDPGAAPVAKELSRYEQKVSDMVQSKLDLPLFEVSVRVLTVASDAPVASLKANALLASFRLFTSPYQSLIARGPSQVIETEKFTSTWFGRRLFPKSSNRLILAASELTDLYHFPNTSYTKTPGLAKSRSPELPIPLSLRRPAAPGDTIFGYNQFSSHKETIRLPVEHRLKHTYVFGRTGVGKTTLLTRAAYEDMLSGRGLVVLDPHGDMFHDLLRVIPADRRGDVVVFDPSEREWPIGLNLLNPGIRFDNDQDARDWITSSVISVFAKLADEKFWGPRMEHILRSVTLSALQTPDPNLYTLQRLLTDRHYQLEVAAKLDDPVLQQFWYKELRKLGDMQLASVTAPLTQRLGSFITTGMSRHILLQRRSTISISDIMEQGKILLVNLSKGDIGEDQSKFFGTILTSFIWMAAYQRTRLPEPDRRDFFVYVDEFQNFATRQFADMASEGRKFHVSLILSHQNVAQIADPNILNIIAGNAGTLISFAGSPHDDAFIQPFMAPAVRTGDILNLQPHNFYAKVRDMPDADAFSGVTTPLNVVRSDAVAGEVRSASNQKYGTHRSVLDAYLQQLLVLTRTPANGSVLHSVAVGPRAVPHTSKKSRESKRPSRPEVPQARGGRRKLPPQAVAKNGGN
jgi:hypothetical protein